MRKFTTFLVAFLIATAAFAGSQDHRLRRIVDDVRKGNNTQSQIQDLRVKNTSTFGGNVTFGGGMILTNIGTAYFTNVVVDGWMFLDGNMTFGGGASMVTNLGLLYVTNLNADGWATIDGAVTLGSTLQALSGLSTLDSLVVKSGTNDIQIFAYTTNAWAQGMGAKLQLGGNYTAGNNEAPWVQFWGRKWDATNGTTAGQFELAIKQDGVGEPTTVLTVTPDLISQFDGNVALAATTLSEGVRPMREAKFYYDFAVDGGAVTNNPHVLGGGNLPDNAIVWGGFLDVYTALATVESNAQIAVGLNSGVDLLAATYVTNKYDSTGINAIIPVQTAATAVKAGSALPIHLDILKTNLSAGAIGVHLFYTIGD